MNRSTDAHPAVVFGVLLTGVVLLLLAVSGLLGVDGPNALVLLLQFLIFDL